MRYRVTVDTAEKAASRAHDCGLFHMPATDADVKEKVEAFVLLGFTPSVTLVEEQSAEGT